MSGLKTPNDLQVNTVTQQATQKNPENRNQLATTAKSQVTIETSAVTSKEKKTKPEKTRIVLTITTKTNSGQTNSNSSNKNPNKANANNTNNQEDRRPRLVYPPCETSGKTNRSTEKCYLEANAANRPPPRNRQPDGQLQVQLRNAQNDSEGNVQAVANL